MRPNPLGSLVSTLLIVSAFAAPASGSSVVSVSRVTGPPENTGIYEDSGFFSSTPSMSSVSHGYFEVNPDFSYNYGAEAAGAGNFGSFSLFAYVGGSASDDAASPVVQAQSQMFYSDSIIVSGGTGPATVRIPFLVDGRVDLSTYAGVLFGFTFCQSIPTGCLNCGVVCGVKPPHSFLFGAPSSFSDLIDLDFRVEFGVPYDLNFTVTLRSNAAGVIGLANADFRRTGTAQPAQVFDQSGTLVPNATIVADSGFDYIKAVPEPAGLVLACTGVLLLLAERAQRATSL